MVVDDWDLVAADDRRLLGRMLREGTLAGAGGDRARAPAPSTRRSPTSSPAPTRGGAAATDVVLSNPFGMGVLDVALAAAVHDVALARDLGTVLPGG